MYGSDFPAHRVRPHAKISYEQEKRMSLDETLSNLNDTLATISDLLKTIEIAIIIVAVALSFLLIGMTCTCYYSKYKKYNQLVNADHKRHPSYEKSDYHPTAI